MMPSTSETETAAPFVDGGAAVDVTEELVALKRKKAALLQKKISLVKEFGLKYYRPHPKQAQFHSSPARFRMVRSGNRFGKSTMGVGEDGAWALGYRPWLPEGDPGRRANIPQRATKGLVITTDWETVDDVFTGNRGTLGKFWKVLPKSEIKSALRNHMGSIDTIEFQNGSLIKFATVKSFMSNPQSAESKDWDWIHVDEPCPEAMWKAVSRGLIDRGGFAWFTLTPLREPWITDLFFPEETGGMPKPGFWAIDGSTYDNIYLSVEAIKAYEESLTPEERECRIHGKPLHLAGLVYKEFDRERHVLKVVPSDWESFTRPPRNYTYYAYIDPHPQTPHAILLCAVSPFGQHFYFADIFSRCSIAELCKQLFAVLDGRPLAWVRLDPLAWINNPITESTMADEFQRCGLPVNKAIKALEAGIIRVKGRLAEKDCIYFTPECRRTLWEMQRYSWEEKENKPVDKDDHMMENLYRAELEDMIWIDPKPNLTPVADEAFTFPSNWREEEPVDVSVNF